MNVTTDTQTTNTSPIQLTPSALRELSLLLEQKNVSEEYGLRVGVKGGGCAGFSYILGFDKKKDNDNEFQVGDMKVFMDKTHGIYLAGLEIDYYDGLNNRGFVFNNPNASETCGCGSSFS